MRRLVYVLANDPLIGMKFEARVAELLPDGTFSLHHIRLDPFSYRNFDLPFTDEDKAIFKILREITYDKLVQNFSKSNSELQDFLHNKGEDFYKKIFRPYVERRLISLISHCRIHGIPLHFLNANGSITDVPLVFSDQNAEVTYHFNHTPEALTYSIRVSVGGKPVVLGSPSMVLLTDQPAWFVYEGVLYTTDGVNGNKIKPFLQRESLTVPPQTVQKYFATFIRGLLRQSRISQSGFQVSEEVGRPAAVLHLDTDWTGEPVMILKFRYDREEIPADHPDPRLVSMGGGSHPPSFRVTVRDHEAEQTIVDLLNDLGLKLKGDSVFTPDPAFLAGQPAMVRLIEFARANYDVLIEHGVELTQRQGSEWLLAPPAIRSKAVADRDWFDLEIEVEAGGEVIPFFSLKESILNGKREYLTPAGKVFLIPEEWFSRFRGVLLFGRQSGNRCRISRMHLGSLDADRGDALNLSESREGLIGRIFSELPDLSGDSARHLRPYQETGLRWMSGLVREGFGGCLADDMGLGKTLQVLALLESTGMAGNVGPMPSLAVMPVSLLHNWENEIRKFTPKIRYYRLSGPLRNPQADWLRGFDLVLTSYGTLRNDIGELVKTEFRFLVMDESQHAKNADSVTFKALSRINARFRLSMTGTPVENSLEDLWSQMSLVNPGLLGSRHWFREHFLRGRDFIAPGESADLIRAVVKPFILRRTKGSVAPELPELTQEIRYCEPTEAQWSVYESRKSDIRNFLLDRFREPVDGTTRMLVLQSLMKLRLIANHPVMADPAYTEGSGKMNELSSMIREVVSENQQVLVFSQFVKHLKLIGAELDSAGIPYLMLTGQDSAARREEMIARFQNREGEPVFLVSLKAGGVGLNLTRAGYVFLADPWWNPAVENQAVSRAHRIGQENPVFSYRFITTGTIEEKILLLQERKQNLADIFVNRNALDLINPDEILELLT